MKGVIAKIFERKELGEAPRVEGISLEYLDTLCTFPVWAFHILGKGCPSQERGMVIIPSGQGIEYLQ